jgi:LysR family transcriptional regulator of abg operon
MATGSEQARRLASRLRFRHLQLLLALDEGGSLRAAAQALNFTQPALSKALAEIEAAFGLPLFTRTARGLAPTPQGSAAVRGARLLLHELEHVREEAAAAACAAAVVRIGAPPFVAHGHLPAVIARLAASTPRVHVELLEERVPLLMDALAEGRVDALVTSYPPAPPDGGTGLRYEKLFDTEYAVIAPPRHQVAGTRRVDWPALALHDWILPARTSMVRRMVEDTFMRGGAVPPVPVVESTSPVTNVQLVAAGIGLAVVPLATLLHAGKGLVVRVPATPAIAPGPVGLISRAGPENPRLQLVRDALAALAVPARRGRWRGPGGSAMVEG